MERLLSILLDRFEIGASKRKQIGADMRHTTLIFFQHKFFAQDLLTNRHQMKIFRNVSQYIA